MRLPRLLACLGLAVLAGCAYRGAIDEPPTQKLTWFSYLDGTDIRAACGPGSPDRYRLVYNARYDEQLRSYEVTEYGDGGLLIARAQGPANLLRLTLDDPQGPWRWRRSESRLSPAEMAAFEAAARDSGLFEPAPEGLWLHSGTFYWVAAACVDGRFHYGAWVHPSAAFAALRFPDFLFERDGTGLAVNPPRPLLADERLGPRGKRELGPAILRFRLQVGEAGLAGRPGLL